MQSERYVELYLNWLNTWKLYYSYRKRIGKSYFNTVHYKTFIKYLATTNEFIHLNGIAFSSGCVRFYTICQSYQDKCPF